MPVSYTHLDVYKRQYLQIAITTVAGCYFAYTGAITVGMLLSFSGYITTLLWPVRQLGRLLSDLGKTFVSLTRISEVLHEPCLLYTSRCV